MAYGKFYSVVTANLPSSGIPGDIYYDTTRGLLFSVVGDGSLIQLLTATPIPVKGDPGVQGVPGPTGPQGPVLMFMGNWQSTTTYAQGSMVTYNGSLYLSSASQIGTPPEGNPFFQLLGALPSQTSEIVFAIEGGGSVPSLGSKGYITIPYAAKITGWNLLADQPGSAVLEVKWAPYSSFPTTTSIVGSSNPQLVSQQKNQGDVSGFTKTQFSSGDILEIVLLSATTVTQVTATILITSTN